MQLLYYAPKLTAPTFESLREYADKKFSRLSRFVPKLSGEHSIRIAVEKQRHDFVLSVEIPLPRPIFIEVRNPNLYAAIDDAYSVIKKTVTRYRGKQRGL